MILSGFEGDGVRCLGCGRLYSHPEQFEQVCSLGLALRGRCACGAWVTINQIWRKVREMRYQQITTNAHSAHSEQQLKLF